MYFTIIERNLNMSEYNSVSTENDQKKQKNEAIKTVAAKVTFLEEELTDVCNKLNDIKSQNRRKSIITILILLLLAFLIVLHFNIIQINHINSKAVLMVSIVSESDVDASNNITDETQVRNALKNGGMIIVVNSSEGFKKAFGEYYTSFGAANKDNKVYLVGAAINYIASNGWTLVQGPSSALSTDFYFEKYR